MFWMGSLILDNILDLIFMCFQLTVRSFFLSFIFFLLFSHQRVSHIFNYLSVEGFCNLSESGFTLCFHFVFFLLDDKFHQFLYCFLSLCVFYSIIISDHTFSSYFTSCFLPTVSYVFKLVLMPQLSSHC